MSLYPRRSFPVALALALSTGCNAGKPGKNNISLRNSKMPQTSFGLTDEEFWTDPDRNLESTVKKSIEADFMGIMLDGPGKVDVERRKDVTLIGLRRATFEENFLYRHDTHGVIAAISHADNSIHAALAWHDKSEGKEDATTPSEGFPEGSTVSPFEIDVRSRLRDMPWKRGTTTFILYLFDKQSNPVNVEFLSRKPLDVDIESHPPALEVRPPVDPHIGNSFERSPASPPLPEHEGITLVAGKSEVGLESGRCMVHGAFRLKSFAAGNPAGEVVVPLVILVLGSEIAGPYRFTVNVPAKRSKDDASVEGYFNLNLLRMPEAFGIPQRYAIRALHSRTQSSPAVISLTRSTSRK